MKLAGWLGLAVGMCVACRAQMDASGTVEAFVGVSAEGYSSPGGAQLEGGPPAGSTVYTVRLQRSGKGSVQLIRAQDSNGDLVVEPESYTQNRLPRKGEVTLRLFPINPGGARPLSNWIDLVYVVNRDTLSIRISPVEIVKDGVYRPK